MRLVCEIERSWCLLYSPLQVKTGVQARARGEANHAKTRYHGNKQHRPTGRQVSQLRGTIYLKISLFHGSRRQATMIAMLT
jgi:hypothetical protein